MHIPLCIILSIWGFILSLQCVYKLWGALGVVICLFIFPGTYTIAPFIIGFSEGDWLPVIVSYSPLLILMYISRQTAEQRQILTQNKIDKLQTSTTDTEAKNEVSGSWFPILGIVVCVVIALWGLGKCSSRSAPTTSTSPKTRQYIPTEPQCPPIPLPPPQDAQQKKNIMAWQQFLKDQGFYRGAIDGLWGDRSAQACQKYLSRQNSLSK